MHSLSSSSSSSSMQPSPRERNFWSLTNTPLVSSSLHSRGLEEEVPNWTPFSGFHSRFFFASDLAGAGDEEEEENMLKVSVREMPSLPSSSRGTRGDALDGAKKSTNIFQGCSSEEGGGRGGRRFISAQGIVFPSAY